MKSAPKKTRAAETRPMTALRKIDFRRMFSTDFFVPQTNSSVTIRVTAVQMPDEAKVEAST